ADQAFRGCAPAATSTSEHDGEPARLLGTLRALDSRPVQPVRRPRLAARHDGAEYAVTWAFCTPREHSISLPRASLRDHPADAADLTGRGRHLRALALREWSVTAFICTAGPSDRPFEERPSPGVDLETSWYGDSMSIYRVKFDVRERKRCIFPDV